MKTTPHFRDQVVIVTGGAAGIGRALCEAFAANGALVIVTDINAALAEQTAAHIVEQGGQAHALYVDVGDLDSMRAMVEQVRTAHGRVDIMINNAGIALIGELRDMTLAHWQRIVDINLMGVIYGTKLAYDIMVEQGHGHIVNVASGSGLFPEPMRTGYNATKFGVVGLSQGLRSEAMALGVNVSVVCPGVVLTGIFDTTEKLQFDPQFVQSQLERVKQVAGISAEKCARITLKGIRRNRGIIPITPLVYTLWWFYRVTPGLYTRLQAWAAAAMRRNRLPL